MQDYEEHHTDTTVHFRLHMTEDNVRKAEEEGLEKRFKLSSTFNTSNMVCFDLNSKIKKYSSAEEILVDFYHKRLEYYGLRKVSNVSGIQGPKADHQQHLADELSNEFERLSNQARFVQMIIAKELVVSNKKKSAIVSELRDLKFKPIPKVAKAKEEGETEPAVEDEEGEDGDGNDFDYLLGMRIYSLTKERVGRMCLERRHQLTARLISCWRSETSRRMSLSSCSSSRPKLSGITTWMRS
jgi:DNA topoisomerase-2